VKKPTNVVYYMRKRLGLNQDQIAKDTGLTKNDISRLENGISNAYIEKYITLAQYFKMPLTALLFNNINIAFPTFTKEPKVQREMLKRIRVQKEKDDETGYKGEEWVYKEELKKLDGTMYKNAVNPNFADDEEAHFDILSFSHDGEPIIIEVKTTTTGPQCPFYITSDEIEKARNCLKNGERYEIHRVYYIDNPEKCGRQIITAEELFREFDFIPDTYKVVRKDEKE